MTYLFRTARNDLAGEIVGSDPVPDPVLVMELRMTERRGVRVWFEELLSLITQVPSANPPPINAPTTASLQIDE